MHNEEDVKIVTMIGGGKHGSCKCRRDTCNKIRSLCDYKGICISSVIRKYLPECNIDRFESDEDSLNAMMYVLYILSADMSEYNCYSINCTDCAWFEKSTEKCNRINIRLEYEYLYSLRSYNGI